MCGMTIQQINQLNNQLIRNNNLSFIHTLSPSGLTRQAYQDHEKISETRIAIPS